MSGLRIFFQNKETISKILKLKKKKKQRKERRGDTKKKGELYPGNSIQ